MLFTNQFSYWRLSRDVSTSTFLTWNDLDRHTIINVVLYDPLFPPMKHSQTKECKKGRKMKANARKWLNNVTSIQVLRVGCQYIYILPIYKCFPHFESSGFGKYLTKQMFVLLCQFASVKVIFTDSMVARVSYFMQFASILSCSQFIISQINYACSGPINNSAISYIFINYTKLLKVYLHIYLYLKHANS